MTFHNVQLSWKFHLFNYRKYPWQWHDTPHVRWQLKLVVKLIIVAQFVPLDVEPIWELTVVSEYIGRRSNHPKQSPGLYVGLGGWERFIYLVISYQPWGASRLIANSLKLRIIFCMSVIHFANIENYYSELRITRSLIQWNPFIGTTVGTDRSGPIRGVVLLEGLKSH